MKLGREHEQQRGCWVVWEVYKHTRPTEKRIPLPTVLLLKSWAHISAFFYTVWWVTASCWILLRRARILKVIDVVVRLLSFSSWLILKQQSVRLWFLRIPWYFTFTIHRPYPLVPDDSSSINTSPWSVKPLLGYADVKNAWSFTSSPFIRSYSVTKSKDMVNSTVSPCILIH